MKTTAFLICIALIQTPALLAKKVSVSSPNGLLKAMVSLTNGKLLYSIKLNESTIISESPLGLKSPTIDLSEGLTLIKTEKGSVNDTYTLPIGKYSQYCDHCNTLSLMTRKGAWQMNVLFRLYDDGFAFRYEIPQYGNHSSIVLTEEASRIRISDITSIIACPFLGNKGGNDPNYPYEGLYTTYTNWQALIKTGDARFNSPTLVYNGTNYLLISEADNRGYFCTSLTKAEEREGEFSYSWTGQTKNYAQEKGHSISSSLPAYTPWRMVVCGDIKTIFETTMTENLCPPTSITNLNWIKPGVAAWYWGGSDGGKGEVRDAYGGLYES